MDSKDTCPTGGSHKWVYDIVGEKSCTKCGLWKKVTSEVGYSPEKGDYGLGGTIGKKGSGFGKIAPNTKFVSFDKILALAKKLIKAYTEKVSSQKIISSRTEELFKNSRKTLKGKDTQSFVAACLHIACREQEIPSSPIIIAELANVKRDKLVDIFNQICKLHKISLPPDKADKKVRYVASKASMPEFFSRKAIKILNRIPSSETGSNPTGIAAAALYLVSFPLRSFLEFLNNSNVLEEIIFCELTFSVYAFINFFARASILSKLTNLVFGAIFPNPLPFFPMVPPSP